MIASNILVSLTPSAPQKKAISTATTEAERLAAIDFQCAADHPQRQSQLHDLADQAMQAFESNPTIEKAEAYHQALIRCRDASESAEHIGNVVRLAVTKVSRSLEDVALSLVDAAQDQLASDREKALSGISGDAARFVDVASMERRFADAQAELEAHRPHLRRDPLQWLRDNTLAI